MENILNINEQDLKSFRDVMTGRPVFTHEEVSLGGNIYKYYNIKVTEEYMKRCNTLSLNLEKSCEEKQQD